MKLIHVRAGEGVDGSLMAETRELQWEPPGRKSKAPRIPDSIWEQHRDQIVVLHSEGHTLDDIMKIMRRRGENEESFFNPTYGSPLVLDRVNHLALF